jgi:alkanesulfonate monooxygenase SsuD/methylene tetrahydromethanopterin reductase-like flavin-dependent oxidoreductase (luciferase family)
VCYAACKDPGITRGIPRSSRASFARSGDKVPPHFSAPPGHVPVEAGVRMMRGEEHPLSAFRRSASVEGAIAAGIMMAGTPDQVEAQLRKVYDHVGGFGHLLIMGQAGFLEHDETVAGIRTFAREVYPRVRAW